MPSLEVKLITEILSKEKEKFPIFVETGTAWGGTIFNMESIFSKLYTIEVKPELHFATKNKYKGDKISFILGDSGVQLSNVIKEIKGSKDKKENVVFFLDGHWSGGPTGRGAKDCPLLEEIQTINDNLTSQAIIIVDDYQLFGKCPKNGTCNEDWGDISKEKILRILKNRITKVYHLPPDDSRLVIHISVN